MFYFSKKCVAWSASVPAAASARFLSSTAGNRSCRRNCPHSAHHNSEQWITDTKARTVGIVQKSMFKPVLRIRIRMFLGLLDPDPLVRGTDPDPYSKNSKKSLDPYCDFL